MMQLIQALRYENYTGIDETGLVKFIIDTAIKQGTQAFNTVHWALMLEYQNDEDNSQDVCEFFKSVYDRLIEKGNQLAAQVTEDTLLSIALRNKLNELSKHIKELGSVSNDRKNQELLAKLKSMKKIFSGGLPLPHDPLVKVDGVVLEKEEKGKLK